MGEQSAACEPFSCVWTQGGSEYSLSVAGGALELKRNGELLIATCERERFEWIFRIAELHRALERARVDLEDWAGYAGDYFREKHDLAGDLKAIDDVLQVKR